MPIAEIRQPLLDIELLLKDATDLELDQAWNELTAARNITKPKPGFVYNMLKCYCRAVTLEIQRRAQAAS